MITPLFESFTDIYIHEEVYKELDEKSKAFVDLYIGKNVTMVGEGDLYGRDPRYTTIFNHIAGHELVNYVRGRSKDRGEVYSLAYAAYHKYELFLFKRKYYAERNDNSYSKGLKSMYKKHCSDVIKRHGLPATLGKYIKAVQDYL